MKLLSVVFASLIALALSSTGFAAKQQANQPAAQTNAASQNADANANDSNDAKNPQNTQNTQQSNNKKLAQQKNYDQQNADDSTEND